MIVETVNQHIVAEKIDKYTKKLDTLRDRFVLLLSDAANYMTASSTALKLLYLKLFHITCIAHLLHNYMEKVSSHFQDIDNLIAHVKASTVKNKAHRQIFSDIGNPPKLIVTYWGSWLHVAEYYATNLVKVHEIINSFDGDGIIVRYAKEAVNEVIFVQLLAQIQRHYMCIPKLISKLQCQKIDIFCQQMWKGISVCILTNCKYKLLVLLF